MKDFGSRSKMMASYKWPNLRGRGGGGDEGGKGDLNWKWSSYLNGRKYFIQQNSTTGTSDSFSIVLGLKNFSCQTTPKFKMAAVLLWKRDSAHFVRTMRLFLSVCSCVFVFDDKNPSLVCTNGHLSPFFPRAQRLSKTKRDKFCTPNYSYVLYYCQRSKKWRTWHAISVIDENKLYWLITRLICIQWKFTTPDHRSFAN